MKKILITLSALSVLVLAGCQQGAGGGNYTSLAQCLTDKGVKFYGAFWCQHCTNQKNIFGSDMEYITYIECDDRDPTGDSAACRAAGVERYPTWFFPGQGNITGVQQPEQLAQKANCEIAPQTQQEEPQTQETAQPQETL